MSVKRYTRELDGAGVAMMVLASDYEQLQADNARLRKDYEEGLEAWKKNNEFFGGWCERLAKTLEGLAELQPSKEEYINVSEWKAGALDMALGVSKQAREVLAEYKAARVGR